MSFQHENDEICRVCTHKQDDTSSIFETETFLEQPLVISEVMTTCASIQVYKNDGLPENICIHCLEGLHQAYTFRKLCERSDSELRNRMLENEFCWKREIKTEKEDEPEFVDTNDLCAANTEVKVEWEFRNADEKLNYELEGESDAESDEQGLNGDCSLKNDLLVAHEYTTTEDNLNDDKQCKICRKTFDDESNLAAHMKSHTKLECGECGKRFSKPYMLRNHVKHHLKIRSLTCQVCSASFVTIHELEYHKRIHSVKSHACPICSKRFATSKYLRTHQRRHATEKTTLCDLCGKQFKDNDLLTKHKQRHKKRTYKCEACDKIYARKQAMLIHHKTTHLLRCIVCNMQFTEAADLTEHNKTHVRPYQCKLCDKSYVRNSDLNVHMKFHSQERPYKCETCSKAFKVRGALNKHVIIHKGIKPFECNVCGQKFARNHSLQTHMKLHNPTHECGKCGKMCVDQKALQKHMGIHTGDKPHECDVCGKQYTERTNLMKHKRVHSDEKRFKCDTCEESFYRKDTLVQHIRKHTGQRVCFQCDECKKEFSSNSNLIKHKKLHARVKQNHA